MKSFKNMTRHAFRAAAAVAIGGAVLSQMPSAEAAATNSTPILVVHGASLPNPSSGIDCKDSVMLPWVNGLKARGFTNVKTVGYYSNDRNCDLWVPGRADNTVNTSLDLIGREFANLISSRYGSTPVAISAHSMGGLVVRRALAGVQNRHPLFPTNIRVSDVVTAGTPHAGTGAARACAPFLKQCEQMVPGSGFLGALAHNPQTAGSTDWTLTGSDCDLVVSADSATRMNQVSPNRPPIFRQIFPDPGLCIGGVSHDELVTKTGPLNVINTGLRTGN